MFGNAYQAYTEGTVYSNNPMQLITALYEAGISSVQEAQRCLASGDIMARSAAVTKGVNILSELLVSLNHEKGGDISQNLQRLYGYMQQRLLEAHMKKTAGPLAEVEGLLKTLLEAWYVVAENEKSAPAQQSQAAVAAAGAGYASAGFVEPELATGAGDVLSITYGGYYSEAAESYSAVALSC